MSALLKKNNITLTQREKKYDDGKSIDDHERFHALKDGLSRLITYLIDSGASNHMVASEYSFRTLNLMGGPTNHMGDDSQIPAAGRGSIKI